MGDSAVAPAGGRAGSLSVLWPEHKKPAYDLSQKQASAPQAGAVQRRSGIYTSTHFGYDFGILRIGQHCVYHLHDLSAEDTRSFPVALTTTVF